jgi:hypothetical protein
MYILYTSLRVNSRKFRVIMRKLRVITWKFRVNSRKFRVITRKNQNELIGLSYICDILVFGELFLQTAYYMQHLLHDEKC